MKKLNGYAKSILCVIALLGIFANTIISLTIAKNDLVHLARDVEALKTRNTNAHNEIKDDLKEMKSELKEIRELIWRRTNTAEEEK